MRVMLKSSIVTVSKVKDHYEIFHKLTILGLYAEPITASFI